MSTYSFRVCNRLPSPALVAFSAAVAQPLPPDVLVSRSHVAKILWAHIRASALPGQGGVPVTPELALLVGPGDAVNVNGVSRVPVSVLPHVMSRHLIPA